MKEYNLICRVCNKEFIYNQKTKKTCSETCKRKRDKTIYGRVVTRKTDLPTNTVGAISEMAVASHFLEEGFAVFRSLSSSCLCDLIILKNNKMYRVEVRTGYRNTETGNLSFPKTKNGEIDLYAIRERNTKEIYYVAPDATTLINEIK